MIIPEVSDIAFKVFGISVYWYGIVMAFAIFVALLCANFLLNRLKYKKDLIIEYSPLIIISGIIGARLYFCTLNFKYYLHHLIEILNLRQGGLSIHGAILAGILAIIFIAKKEHIKILPLLDVTSCALILGQSIGRWGNYFNSEAYGIPTASQTWGLFISPEHRIEQFMGYSFYHPTFLYESVLDFAGFAVLLFIFFKNKKDGTVFFSYLTIYSIIRFFIEGIRLDSALTINSVHFPQIISIILIITGIYGLFYVLNKPSDNI